VPSSNGETFYQVNSDIGFCNCVSGAQGGYCKHQAAVATVFGISFPNCPSLTPDDKAELFFIANNTEMHLSFFEPLARVVEEPNTICLQSRDQSDSSCSDDDKENDQNDWEYSESDISDFDEPPDKKCKVDTKQIVENFESACQHIQSLFLENSSDDFLLKSMKKFSANALKLQTGMQLASFCNSTSTARPRVGRKIHVQPTSVVRRTTTKSRNRRVMRSGRPIGGVKKVAKRPRNLALNVSENRLNAKSHGDAH
jgi:hypothetical protein